MSLLVVNWTYSSDLWYSFNSAESVMIDLNLIEFSWINLDLIEFSKIKFFSTKINFVLYLVS